MLATSCTRIREKQPAQSPSRPTERSALLNVRNTEDEERSADALLLDALRHAGRLHLIVPAIILAAWLFGLYEPGGSSHHTGLFVGAMTVFALGWSTAAFGSLRTLAGLAAAADDQPEISRRRVWRRAYMYYGASTAQLLTGIVLLAASQLLA